MSMQRFRPGPLAVSAGRSVCMSALLAAAFVAGGSASAQTSANGEHPDFNGVWFPAGRRSTEPDPLPFTPAAQALVEQYAADFETNDDPGRFCIWPGVPRSYWGAPFAVEIFHRPQDVTVYYEGYAMYRKIYMADHNPPEPILPTAMGHSVAHWEGDTLVIETTNLRVYPYMNRMPTTSEAHVSERWWIEQREEDGVVNKYLIAEAVLTDPKLYTEPVHIRGQVAYRPDLYVLEYGCSQTLWEEYLQERDLSLPDVDALPAGGE